MGRIHVVLDPASVPIFADLVGFFSGGPLDQAWMFTSQIDQWIALTENNPDNNVMSFAWFDSPLDGSKLVHVFANHAEPVRPLTEPISMTLPIQRHTYIVDIFRSKELGDVILYRLAASERPAGLPSGYPTEARYRKRARTDGPSFYDRILGRVPSDNNWSRPSDPLSDVMEARRRILESPEAYQIQPWPSFVRPDIGSSTACFECGITVKTEHIWLKKSDPNVALCEGCFRKAETAGRAKESAHAD